MADIWMRQVTGTGGGTSIRHEDKIYIAPSGVQKELMKPTDMFVMDFISKEYLRRPQVCVSNPQKAPPS
jgi:methylthioribulose-1-phosphate dehydratase